MYASRTLCVDLFRLIFLARTCSRPLRSSGTRSKWASLAATLRATTRTARWPPWLSRSCAAARRGPWRAVPRQLNRPAFCAIKPCPAARVLSRLVQNKNGLAAGSVFARVASTCAPRWVGDAGGDARLQRLPRAVPANIIMGLVVACVCVCVCVCVGVTWR